MSIKYVLINLYAIALNMTKIWKFQCNLGKQKPKCDLCVDILLKL